ncbi:MAG: hypothetical protein WD530_06075 [Vicingaceae bacterium]
MIYILLLFPFFGQLAAQEASAVLNDKEIRLGEQTTIELELRFNASEKAIMMPALRDTISKFIEVLNVSAIDTAFDEDDITTKIFTQNITITSWDSGYHAIPPFEFKVGNDTIRTEPLLLSVMTVPLDPQADIKDIKEIMEVPFSLWDWILKHKLWITVIVLLIVTALIGYYFYKKYKNKPTEEKQVFVPKEAADIVALKKLEQLKHDKLWQSGKVKEFYVELSFIMREYISNRYQFHALEHTTDEIMSLANRNSELSEELKKKLLQTLMLADMAKFARQKPLGDENETALKNAFYFVNETAVKEEEKDINSPKDTKEGEKK